MLVTFESAAFWNNRTPAACGTRWNILVNDYQPLKEIIQRLIESTWQFANALSDGGISLLELNF